MDFQRFFAAVYRDRSPYPYQKDLAEVESWPTLLDIPTGLGKTAAVLGGWCYRRFFHPSDEIRRSTPRRLVYVLPMRVLCEQTFEEARRWCDCVCRLAEQAADPQRAETVGTHLLMGGQQPDDWDRWPEREAILVGTQDMLLSRPRYTRFAL